MLVSRPYRLYGKLFKVSAASKDYAAIIVFKEDILGGSYYLLLFNYLGLSRLTVGLLNRLKSAYYLIFKFLGKTY